MIIDGEDRHPHAARRLRDSVTANAQSRVRLQLDEGLKEGAYVIAAEADAIVVRGGPFSGVIYGVEELIERAGAHLDPAAFSNGPVSGEPGLAYRTFWTWDHSTNWELSQIGQQEIGVFNPFQKPPKGFLDDYRRLVDFCSKNRIAAIVVYGFLRDSHGGIEAAQELCRYANERGVRIIPGIAIGAYGGVYWEGKHRYNLSTWLKQNPQHAATMEKDVGFQLADLAFPLNFPHSDYTVSACPSAPEVIDWMEEAVSWLAETFEIGGINIESGDYGVCGCERCRLRRGNDDEARRRVDDHGDSWSHTDMAANFPRLYNAAKAKRPDLWIYCEMQWDNLLEPVASEAQKALPPGAIYQHTANRSYWRRLRTELDPAYVSTLPTQPNVLRCQFACQWNGDERTERYALNAKTFADMATRGKQLNMEGLTVWGEPSDYFATVEISYLAFARFCWNPELTWAEFMQRDVAPLLGGAEAAERFVALAEELDGAQALPAQRLGEIQKEALAQAVAREGRIARRWMTLADQVGRRLHMGR
ncbi:hypothetical protein [Mesorhizobium marinum]|uniref:hypothetical protein n=1 Tax=Mesorhizobium marinum TaxID=3228790 RepID=UPI0034657D30